jgi:hypothetical protein
MDIAFIMHKVFLTSYLPAGVLEMNTQQCEARIAA